jgi:GMP synthase (glutamine-hydrolysing)
MNIHFIVHEYFEAPGAYATWAKKNGCTVTYSRVYDGDDLPQSIEAIDFLIVMGGPQNPSTTIEECPHFNSKKEQAVIKKAIIAGKVVLGVCLGSQLIAQALGAMYEQSPEKEIGKFPITLTKAGLNHPLFSHFGKVLEVGHWHNDMPGLTQTAEVIAYSEGCPRQIVAYTERVYGFQCHMELTTEVVELLIANDDLSNSAGYNFVETPKQLMSHNYSEMNQKLYDFLNKLTVLYQSKVK